MASADVEKSLDNFLELICTLFVDNLYVKKLVFLKRAVQRGDDVRAVGQKREIYSMKKMS